MRTFWFSPVAVMAVLCAGGKALGASGKFSVERTDDAVVITNTSNALVLRYQLRAPTNISLSVESACYFHPLATPAGRIVTDVAPSDHLHHRGIFLAWVEMHGKKDADFWGWGEHAPTNNRKIVNRSVTDLRADENQASFRAHNEWLAEGETLLREELHAVASARPKAHLLDLTYTLTADADLKLARWALSGFCVRAPKSGRAEALGPNGPVRLPAPSHLRPESDWPAAPWYAYTLRFDRVASVAVIDHPKNPPSLWHNHPELRMLNPCIIAPGPMTLKAKEPLALRYRVVASDGEALIELLNKLSEEWRKE